MKVMLAIFRWIVALVLMAPFVLVIVGLVNTYLEFKKESGEFIANEAMKHPDSTGIIVLAVTFLMFAGGITLLVYRPKEEHREGLQES